MRHPGASVRRGGWTAPSTAPVNAFAGQTAPIAIEANEAAGESLVEAAVDNVTVKR